MRIPTRFIVLLLVGLLSACASNSAIQSPTLGSTQTIPTVIASETAKKTETISTVKEGSGPSYKVAAFDYPWYGNPDTDGKWIHWAQNNHLPPDDIGADYYPALGAYSSNDPGVVAQHMEWLRQAGIGVVITSWWGQGSGEDQVVPLLLQTTEGFGIKVAFHIEPPQSGRRDGNGYGYEDFDSLPPEGYLSLTREWVETYLAMSWPSTYRARLVLATTSDWTTLEPVSGGVWIGPELVSASPSALMAGMEAGDRFVLTQSLDDANAGTRVGITWDVSLTDLEASQDLRLQIDRGNIGKSQVTILNYLGETPIEVKSFEWDQVTGDRNSQQITVPSALLMGSDPQGGKP